MKEFNLDSYTYDKLSQLAVGIAEQETKFGTSLRKKLKDNVPEAMIDIAKYLRDGKTGSRSRGATQIKMSSDNEEMQNFYRHNGLTSENVDADISKSALATIGRLAMMYNNEVRGRHFTGAGKKTVNAWDALLYKWLGKNAELTRHTATPESNTYINNVKHYMKGFRFITQI